VSSYILTGGEKGMAEQETLIYIDEKDEINASITAREFTKEETKNRAYYNSLGAQLVKKFLASENIDVSNIYNIHNIRKILEEFDISDLMLNNIHIDVRVVFNENYIFIPKSHFNYEILPDIYLVLLMSNDKKYMKFLGFFEPKLINKNNQNEDFYFIEKEKLTSPVNLKAFIKRFHGNTAQEISGSELEEADMIMLSMVDHDVTDEDKKRLLKNLVKSAQLRDRFIEFENFELLAYGAQTSPDVEIPLEQHPRTLDFAASATAVALQDFNNANSEPFAESGMSNGFVDAERNLPGLAPESDEINSEFDLSSLADSNQNSAEEISAVSDGGTDTQMGSIEDFKAHEYDEEVNVEDSILNEAFDESFNITDSTEDFSIEDISEAEDRNNAEISETQDFETQSETMEIAGSQNSESVEILDFSEIPAVEETKNQEINQETETVSLDEIPVSDEITMGQSEEIEPETVDINEITEAETKPVINNEIHQEAVDIDELPIENKDGTISETSITEQELQTFDNLDLDQHENEAMLIDSDTEPVLEQIEIPDFSNMVAEDSNDDPSALSDELFEPVKPDGLLTEVFNKELAVDELEEVVPVDEIKSEDILQSEDTVVEKISDSETKNIETIPEIGALDEDETEKMIMPEDVMISEEDRELDEMLSLESLDANIQEEALDADDLVSAPVEEEKAPAVNKVEVDAELGLEFDDEQKAEPEMDVEIEPETEINIETEMQLDTSPETQAMSEPELQTKIEAEPKAEDSQDTIADLDINVNEIGKASLIGGVEYDENSQMSTGELISQIDDLLSSDDTEKSEILENADVVSTAENSEIAKDSTAQTDISEIPDISSLDEQPQAEGDDDKLEVLFNSALAQSSEEVNKLEEDMLAEDESAEDDEEVSSFNNKKMIIVAAAAFLTLVAVSAGGFFWWKNSGNSELAELQEPNSIENETLPPASGPDPDLSSNAPDKSDLLSDTPAPVQAPPKAASNPASDNAAKPAAQPSAQKAPAQPAKAEPAAPSKTQPSKTITGSPIAYPTVRNVTWEVPDYLSYSEGVKKYLQTAGKSIRLTLSSDLLLATEYAYSNRIKVALQLKNDGTVENAQIVQSSGSNQINEIVLRTVKETLKVVKPASGEIPTPNFKLGLIINI